MSYKTQTCSYAFGVGDSEDGIWISLESRGEKPEILRDCDISFDLPGLDDIDVAQDIANYLNENVGDLCLTFPSHEETTPEPNSDSGMGGITKH